MLLLSVREDQNVTNTAISRRLTAEGHEVTSASIGRWGLSVPALGLIEAAARVLGVDPGWLAFGAASAAPAPPGWAPSSGSLAGFVVAATGTVQNPASGQPVSEADAGAAVDAVEAVEAAPPSRSPAARPKGRRKA